MERDYGIRFSSNQYLSKEEIKKSLNLTSVDYIWDSVIKYRSLYMNVLDVFSIDKKPYSICYTNGITNQIIKLEKRLNKLDLKLLKVDGDMVNNHFANNILTILALFNQMDDVSLTIIEGIVNESLNVIPQKYALLHNYLSCLKDIEHKNASNINKTVILRLFSILLSGNPNKFENIKDTYRTVDFDNSNQEGIYEGAPINDIEELMDNFLEALNDLDTFAIAKASIVFYYINYIKPFEYFNEEMSILLSKYILNNEGDDATYKPLENILLNLANDDYKKTFIECQKTLDLTYIFNKYVEVMNGSILDIDKYIEEINERAIAEESLKEDSIYQYVDDEDIIKKEEKIEKVERNFVPTIENATPLGVNFERKVSLPTIPSGLDEHDASLIADHLLELCPTLKRGQAEFYARHCTIGKYYTIQQYKEFNNVAYETARTSMDNLALLEFYKKEKIRNKFVYTPVIR